MSQIHPEVAVVSDDTGNLNELDRLLKEEGCRLSLSILPGELSKTIVESNPVDLWVVEITDEDEAIGSVDLLSEQLGGTPIFVGEGLPVEVTRRFERSWRRRFRKKLQSVEIGKVKNESGKTIPVVEAPVIPVLEVAPAKDKSLNVWVLAASTGGPAAVKEFLDNIDPALPISFVYVQHINTRFDVLLAKVLGRHNQFTFSMCNEGSGLKHSHVKIVPVDHQVTFQSDGDIEVSSQGWPGVYSPSIDYVIENIAALYGEKSGAIVFTGMGNDGARGCERMRELGGQVWTQSPETCTISSMPDSVNEQGVASVTGSPAELAAKLTELYS